MRMKKRKNMVDVLVIRVPLCSHPIDVVEVQTVFIGDCKKKISISHLLKEN